MKRNPQPDLALVTQIDWARLAAYIDGEGYVTITAQVHKIGDGDLRRRYDHVLVGVTGTDVRLTAWLLQIFGGNVQWRKTNPAQRRWKSAFMWGVSSARATEILQRCRPYLIIKGEQADLAIAFQATVGRVGVKGHSPEIMERRREIRTEIRQLNARGPRATANAVAVH